MQYIIQLHEKIKACTCPTQRAEHEQALRLLLDQYERSVNHFRALYPKAD